MTPFGKAWTTHCKGVPNPQVIAASYLIGLPGRPDWTPEKVDQVPVALTVLPKRT